MYDKLIMTSGKVADAPTKIKTVYMFRNEIVKVTRGTNLREAAPNALRHLQTNDYGATYVEVLDADSEQLLYSQSRSMSGQISKPHYEWDAESTERKYGVSALFK